VSLALADDTRVSPARHVNVQPVDDRGVLVDLRSGRCWELNPVGFAIWRLLADGRSLADASHEIADRYAVDAEVSRTDVTDLVGALLGAGLVAIAAGARGG
jgi:hypothetical protein